MVQFDTSCSGSGELNFCNASFCNQEAVLDGSDHETLTFHGDSAAAGELSMSITLNYTIACMCVFNRTLKTLIRGLRLPVFLLAIGLAVHEQRGTQLLATGTI